MLLYVFPNIFIAIQLFLHSASQGGSQEPGGVSEKYFRPVFRKIPADQEVPEGKVCRFDSVVTGRPMPNIVWYRDEVKVCANVCSVYYTDASENMDRILSGDLNVHRTNIPGISSSSLREYRELYRCFAGSGFYNLICIKSFQLIRVG